MSDQFFVSGDPLNDTELLWLALSSLNQLVAKWENQAVEYRKRRMFDLAQEAGFYSDELKTAIAHIAADYKTNSPHIGTKEEPK